MSTADPYASPGANLEHGREENSGPVPLWGFSGRIGRLRYLAYFVVGTLVFYLTLGIFGAILGLALKGAKPSMGLMIPMFAVGYVAYLVFGASLVIRRAHDFDVGAKWTLGIFLVQVVAGALYSVATSMHWSIGLWYVLLVPFWIGIVVWALMMLFRRGTPGRNNFGLPPPPNSLAVKIVGIGGPILFFVLGIVGAIVFSQFAPQRSAANPPAVRSQ